MASENETVEAAINRLKHRFDCPNETKKPIKGEWCGACREICTADGTNWCDRNSYLNDVLAIESSWRREQAELQLAIDAEKARHTDDYKDERIRAQDEEIATLKSELKPRRNCDRFASYKEAWKAFQKLHENDVPVVAEMLSWLFVTVAEGGES